MKTQIEQQIKELENKLSIGVTFGTLSEEEIVNIRQQINELKKQLINPFLLDTPKVVENKKEEELVEDDIEECEVELPNYFYERWWKVNMSTEEMIMKNKELDYRTLAIIMVNSKYRGETVCNNFEDYSYDDVENHRYLYKNSIRENKEELEKLSNNKIKTIQRNINKLAENGDGFIEVCVDDNNKVYYKIYPCPHGELGKNAVGKYVKVDSRILKYLIQIYNSTAIKVYCTLLWATELKDGELTYDWIVERVGLSESGKNNNEIANILNNFYMVGLIERSYYYDTKDLPSGKCIPIKHYKYKVNSFSDFKKIQKQGGRKIK